MDALTFHNVFLFFLIVSTLFSFYLFVDVLVLKNKQREYMFNTWQFPMLLAMTMELIYDI
jgi:hypothetical protein